MSLLLHIIVTYIKENIITKLQILYHPPRNPRAGNKSPAYSFSIYRPCAKYSLKGLHAIQEILKFHWFKGGLLGLRQFLATGSPLKLMKNAFYFILKAFLFSRYLHFTLSFWSCRKTTWLISKFMTSQPEKQTITTDILPNTSRRKGN